jgi:molecular chaperone GrpE
MIQALFQNVLKEQGLESVPALGQPFDPNVHEAVATDPSGEHPENQIVEVMQEGYRLKGRLLRPSMVRVSRKG